MRSQGSDFSLNEVINFSTEERYSHF
jgi:hypothetical protein